MTPVRTVRTGLLGLDVALGGGVRFLKRHPFSDDESAVLLVRGGPGTGKSVLAQEIALRLAADRQGDILYHCVEVLPTEVIAQRAGFAGFRADRVVNVAHDEARRAPDAPYEGPALLAVLGSSASDTEGGETPDIGADILDRYRAVARRGYVPTTVVVDSLSAGYNLGAATPRAVADGLCKLAVEQGWALLLIEEIPDDSVMSPWAFAVDTVLSLRLAEEPGRAPWGREVLVSKHRFGDCEPGPHRLMIRRDRVRVIPPLSAWRGLASSVALPGPAPARTLAMPWMSAEQVRRLAVPDGEGICVIVSGESDLESLEGITASISRGPQRQGRFANVWMLEDGGGTAGPRDVDLPCLHQFCDGREWIEEVLFRLSSADPDGEGLAGVRIGPTLFRALYKESTSILEAGSLLVSILLRRGHIVLLFGSEPRLLLRSPVVDYSVTVEENTAARTSSLRYHIALRDPPVLRIPFPGPPPS